MGILNKKKIFFKIIISVKRILCLLFIIGMMPTELSFADNKTQYKTEKDSIVFTDTKTPVLFSLFGKKSGNKINTENMVVKDAVMTEEKLMSIPGAAVDAPGIQCDGNEEAVIDYSNVSEGYVMVQYLAESESKIKAQVDSEDATYTYTLIPGVWAAFPLSEGDGEYIVSVLKNIGDSRYAMILSTNIYVQLSDEFAPFLCSNQYVNYANAPNAVATAGNLASETGDTLETVRNVYNFVTEYLEYDMVLAETVQSGYVPDLDAVLVKRSGICFDYASLMTGMLRTLQIPCKLVIGYADELYHAWISVWLEGEGWIDNIIHFNGHEWRFMDPTFASSGYNGTDTNYAAKYFY